MNQSLPLLITLAAALGCADLVLGQGAAPAAAPLAPEDGIVLLANGQILSGRITRAGDFYYVVLSDGEIRLRPSEVELICRTIDEGYQKKRAAVPRGEIVGHLDLADWCVRHHLHEYAEEQLAAARAIDPSHLKIGLVERRLLLDREREPAETPQANTAPRGPTLDQLDQMVRSLPGGVVDQFANHVQPLLLNNCTTAGCHSANSTTGYSLMRIPLGRNASRRLTQRNLFETLQQVNRVKPAESPLVTASIRPHGGAKSAVFNGRDLAQVQQLLLWVQRLHDPVRGAPAAQAATSAKPTPATSNVLLQSTQPQPVQLDPAAPRPEKSAEPQPASNGASRGSPMSTVDPFDPEAFNRRYFPERETKP